MNLSLSYDHSNKLQKLHKEEIIQTLIINFKVKNITTVNCLSIILCEVMKPCQEKNLKF